MAKQDDYIRYTIRVPADLYIKLQDAAGEKSINAEIVARLTDSFRAKTPNITLSLQAFPPGTPAMTTTLAEFMATFAQTMRETMAREKAEARAERRAAREMQRAADSLLPPETYEDMKPPPSEDDESNGSV